MWGWLSSIVDGLVATVQQIQKLPALIGLYITSLYDMVLDKIQYVINLITALPALIGAYIDNLYNMVLDKLAFIISAISNIPTVIQSVISSLYDMVLDKLQYIIGVIQGIPTAIYTVFSATYEMMLDKLQWIADRASDFVGALNGLYNMLLDKIQYVINLIINLPDLILSGIKAIFIPNPDEIKSDILGLVDSVSHTFNLAIDSEKWLIDSFTEEAIPDASGTYDIPGLGAMQLTFFDTTFLKRGVEFFRPIIRGFIVLLLCFYHYKQLLTFIGQDPGIYATAREEKNAHLEGKGK